MNHITDDRVVFYLRHESIIREWAAIESEVRGSLDVFMTSLVEDVEILGRSLDPEMGLYVCLDGTNWPLLMLHRPAWCDADGHARVGIGVEWFRQRVSLVHDRRPDIGVWVSLDLPRGKELHRRLAELCAGPRKQHGYTGSASWPAFCAMPPAEGEYWLDLSGYRSSVVKEIEATWGIFSGLVDQAVAEVGVDA